MLPEQITDPFQGRAPTAVMPGGTYYQSVPERSRAERTGNSFPAHMVALSFLGDTVTIVIGLCAAYWLRFDTPLRGLGRTTESVAFDAYRGHFIFLTITLLLILYASNFYGTGRPQRLRRVNALILTSCTLWWIAHTALSFELNTLPIVSRIFLACACVCVAGSLFAWRALFDQLLHLEPVAALLRRRIVFVGWSEQSARMLSHIAADPKRLYEVVGCVPSAQENYHLEPPPAMATLGGYGDLEGVIERRAIDIVIVADVDPVRNELVDLVTLCEKELVQLQIIPSCFQVLLSGLHLETTSGVPVLGISRLPLDSPANVLLKRVVDLVGSVVGLIMAAPIIAIFAALIYQESPGPVFYRQRRNGLGGKTFSILKLRSMKLDAERDQRPGWSTKEDSRRLRVGTFMRKWNIDELPQFYNVLTGDMSLVGPRPERPEFISRFKHQIPHYNARHGVKPGITGWAQINGLRGDTDLVDRIRCDLYYIENWSLVLDCQIMLMTFFTNQGAA